MLALERFVFAKPFEAANQAAFLHSTPCLVPPPLLSKVKNITQKINLIFSNFDIFRSFHMLSYAKSCERRCEKISTFLDNQIANKADGVKAANDLFESFLRATPEFRSQMGDEIMTLLLVKSQISPEANRVLKEIVELSNTYAKLKCRGF